MKNLNSKEFKKKLIAITSQDPAQCYQCGKCSAGCPVRDFTEAPPNRVVRYVQLGLFEKAMESPTLWLCAGCQTCTSRCPQGFDLAKFMDAVREVAIAYGAVPGDKKAEDFHNAFLKQIKNFGRAYELGLLIDYKLKSKDFFQDVDLAPSTFSKGKLGLLPHKVKGKNQIKKIFNNSGEEMK
jgi:heterodisulfide reductase subunit C2